MNAFNKAIETFENYNEPIINTHNELTKNNKTLEN